MMLPCILFFIFLTNYSSCLAYNIPSFKMKTQHKRNSPLYVSVGGGGGQGVPDKKTNNFVISPSLGKT